ncbi:cadherin-like domain-containing protein [Aureispira anguillae]|nr:Ig-like domain-containing protein [Aureispira anguillae]
MLGYRQFFIGLLSLFFSFESLSQTSISGVVNSYTNVSSINLSTCESSITVGDASLFAPGDRALIIQMKGANIDQTNTASFGSITNYNSAGLYEFFTIIEVNTGTNTIVTGSFNNSYDPAGVVQLVRVPNYDDVTINGTLTGQAWNGTTGGIVAIYASGTVSLGANIDVTQQGFRGISTPNSPSICTAMDYFYPDASNDGAHKGEGIALSDLNFSKGKGAWSNAGGGGNAHNAGGGGGGNGGAGGRGGEQWQGCGNTLTGTNAFATGGVGGHAMPIGPSFNRLFLGGTGGSGDANSGFPSNSTEGGGIVIIRANSLEGNGFSIISVGGTVPVSTSGAIDGGSGGGAGGSVCLDLQTIGATSLTVDVHGGDGQDIDYRGDDAHGPGGGGGGGILWHNVGTLPGNVTVNASGGREGRMLQTPNAGTTNGALAGGNGRIIASLTLQEIDDNDNDGLSADCDVDDDNDGILDVDECPCLGQELINGSFEDPGGFAFVNENSVPGWNTTASDNLIELWNSGFNGVPSSDGGHFAELNGNEVSSLYQIICTEPGATLSWSIDHRGRAGVDVADFKIGSSVASAVSQQIMSDGTSAWGTYTGTYIVPVGQTSTFLVFESISSVGGATLGNFLDNIQVVQTGQCDADGDGIPNHLDLDSDNDGIPDLVEAGGVDVDGNGQVDGNIDADNDGLIDLYDASVVSTTNVTNTSGDDCQTVGSPAHTLSFTSGTTDASSNVTLTFSVTGAYGINSATFTLTGEGATNLGTFSRLNSDNATYPDCGVPAMNFSITISQANWNLWNDDGTVVINYQANADVASGFCTNSSCISNVAANYQITNVVSSGNNIANSDSDGDGILDVLDLDSDNDGIPDVVEAGGTDVDGDGLADNFADTDGDGFNDAVDGDVGNDGTAENSSDALVLTGVDTDNDGAPDSYSSGDTDGDGIMDQLDLDGDNDGIPDVVEAGGTDADGDGLADNFADTDGDGFNDVVDGDVGNDGTAENIADVLVLTGADTNGDGAPDTYARGDLDGDGILNQFDLDADNDGILDVEEAGGIDANRDGIADGFVDTDGDGFNDVVDGDVGNDGTAENTANATTVTGADGNGDGRPDTYPNDNTDGDNNYNFLDIDADNDGIVDNTEGQATASYLAPAGTDADGDGIDDAYDNDDANFGGAGSGIVPNNADGVDNPDYLDLDSDNDGELDELEGHDTNGDGLVDGTDSPNANTGLSGGTTDTDGDGLLDGYDNNTASTDATNTNLNPNSHPDADGQNSERDWREALDTDQDGVADIVDLDDDNDGILDVDEGHCFSAPVDLINGTVDVTRSGYALSSDFDYVAAQGGSPSPLAPEVFLNAYDSLGGAGNFNYSFPNPTNIYADASGLVSISFYYYDNIGGSTGTYLTSFPFNLITSSGTINGTLDISGDAATLDGGNWVYKTITYAVPPNAVVTLIGFTTQMEGNSSGYNAVFNPVNTEVYAIALEPIIACAGDIDTDGDGIPNHLDLDSDNDGIADIVEAGGVDTNGDGVVDNYTDTDNDGLSDEYDVDNGGTAIANSDSDGDGILDVLDLDSDNDGIPDVVEAGGTDENGDGLADNFADTDGDGFNDVVDGDVGNDGTAENSSDALVLTGADTDNDGAPNSYPSGDTDGDGIINQLDLDGDNDGIPDVVEAGGTDADGDGLADNFADTDGDGFNDVVDGDVGNDGTAENIADVLVLTGADTNGDGAPDTYARGDLDGDGILNQFDLDADNDGILDVEEAGGIDANRDGIADGFVDTDGDGFNDVVDGDVGNDGTAENTANATTVTGADGNGDGRPDTYPNDNQDGDNNYNFLDIDADNDGIVDNTEGQATASYLAPAGTDADGDGIDDAYDNDDANFGGAGSGIVPNNADGVDNPDYLDLDSDNDGLLDNLEGHDTNGDGLVDGTDSPNANTGLSGGATDADGDGLLDGYDNNTASTDATNTNLNGNSHPDVTNGVTIERDWREGNTTYAANDINTTPINETASCNVLTNDWDHENNTQVLTGNITIDTDGDGVPETANGLGTGVTVGGVNEDGTANNNAGTLTQNSDGTYTFIPTANFVGEVRYSYQVCDNGSPQACEEALVTIDVEPLPTTDNGELALAPDANVTYDDLAVSGQVLSNDNDPDGDNITVTGTINIDTDGDGVVDGTAGLGVGTTIAGVDQNGAAVTNAGTLTQNADGSYTFDPVAGFVGEVVYEYTACDDGVPMSCETTTVTIHVLPSVYNSTNAIDDEEFLDKGTTLTANVLDNDNDVEGDSQIGGVSLVSGASQGTVTLNPDGSYTYSPTDPNFSGNDEFVYSICDDGTPKACDTATVYLTILDVNKDYGDAPAAYGVAYHRAMRDGNVDNVLDGGTDVWLGSNTDFENASSASGTDNFDDGISFGTGAGAFPTSVLANQVFNLDITVNSAVADNVFYGLWIDWNADGIYDDFYNGSVATASPTTTTVAVTVPATYQSTQTVNVRLRADDDAFAVGDFSGGRTNGEVEDYQALIVDLPVELLTFTAKLKGKNTGQLNWATATELNNAGYEVEQALPTTGVPVFNPIGYVEGAGTTIQAQHYQYEVPNLVAGVHYFRLKQVDFDGTYAYSNIRALNVEAPLVQKLFPTLLQEGSSTIYIQMAKDDDYKIEILTALGQVVEERRIRLQASAYYEMEVDLAHYVSGVYVVRVSDGTGTYTEKIRINNQ